MYCSRCGGQITQGATFCSGCGAPVSPAVGPKPELKRPALITLLAVLQFIGATIWLLLALFVAISSAAIGDSGPPVAVFGALLLGGIGALQLAGGIGLWKLKGYGRTIQLVFAWVGLIGIPLGTIISILILVYLFKPGIKALFSGKAATELTPDELTQIAAVTQGSQLAVVIVVVLGVLGSVAVIGIVAAIAIPGLLRARMAGNEASAIGALRAINSGQAAFSASCAAGGYAIMLDDLAKPPKGDGVGFISSDLGTNGVARNGYIVTLEKDAAPGVGDVGTAADTCNGARGTPAASYFASAEPVTPDGTGTRYFATDARGTIFQSTSPIANPIASSAVPVQ